MLVSRAGVCFGAPGTAFLGGPVPFLLASGGGVRGGAFWGVGARGGSGFAVGVAGRAGHSFLLSI